jgi:hypothetical protein
MPAPRRLMTATEASFGLRFDVTSLLKSQSGGTLLELHAATPRPKSRRARPLFGS